MRFRTIFGPWGSDSRTSRDPFALVTTVEPAKAPFIYLTTGQNEPLSVPDMRFASQLSEHHFAYEFHAKPGGHAWNQWDAQIPGCFESLFQHMKPSP
jgi:S-formylglutathione hydrolase FrmB